MIEFACSNCNRKIRARDEYAGKRVRCPKCEGPMRVPDSGGKAPAKSADIIKFRCPSCNQKIGVKAKYRGRRVACPKCKKALRIPGAPAKAKAATGKEEEPISVARTEQRVQEGAAVGAGSSQEASSDSGPGGGDMFDGDIFGDAQALAAMEASAPAAEDPLRPAPLEEASKAQEQTNYAECFSHDYYLFRKKVFKIFGGAFHVYDSEGQLVFYSKQKAFKLKEDFRIYSDESRSEELLMIQTPQILDLGATYNVCDSTTAERVGALRRKWVKSIVKDEWAILSTEGREVGIITESSWLGAIVSRVVKWIPQTYTATSLNGHGAATIRQHFNPFVLKYSMTVSQSQSSIDRRLLIAAGILLAAIEGRQGS